MYRLIIFFFWTCLGLSWANAEFEADANYILDQHWIGQSATGTHFLTLGSAQLEGTKSWGPIRVKASLLASHGGHSPSAEVGDAQILSNIDTEGVEGVRFYQVYFAYLKERFEVSLGWRDLSLDFNVSDAALVFINSSFGTSAEWGATGHRGPSIYPFPSFGFFAKFNLRKNLYVAAAVSDPLGERTFLAKQLPTHIALTNENHSAVVEVGGHWQKRLRWGLGAWNLHLAPAFHDQRFDKTGVYSMLEYSLTKTLTGVLRYGEANPRQGRLQSNLVLAFTKKEIFTKDLFGVGFSRGTVAGLQNAEDVYELLYQYFYNEKFNIVVSSQWINVAALSQQKAQATTLRLNLFFF